MAGFELMGFEVPYPLYDTLSLDIPNEIKQSATTFALFLDSYLLYDSLPIESV